MLTIATLEVASGPCSQTSWGTSNLIASRNSSLVSATKEVEAAQIIKLSPADNFKSRGFSASVSKDRLALILLGL